MKTIYGILVTALLFPAFAEAQSPTLAPGARVRVTSPNDALKRHVGVVTEMRGDSIVLAGASGRRTVALANVTSLDVSMGTRSNVGRYALMGLGAGALVGVVSVYASADDCESEVGGCFFVDDGGLEAAAVTVISALGLVAGAIAGAAHRTDRWQPVHGSFKASIAPSRSGGVRLALSRTF